MDFGFSDEQESFRQVVRDFARSEIAPHAERWDRDHVFPVDTVRAMGDLGLFGLPFPERYRGSGAPARSYGWLWPGVWACRSSSGWLR